MVSIIGESKRVLSSVDLLLQVTSGRALTTLCSSRYQQCVFQQCMQTMMSSARVHSPASCGQQESSVPAGSGQSYRANKSKASCQTLSWLHCMARAEEIPALALIWTCQRMMLPRLLAFGFCRALGSRDTTQSWGCQSHGVFWWCLGTCSDKTAQTFNLPSQTTSFACFRAALSCARAEPRRLPAIWHEQDQVELNKC